MNLPRFLADHDLNEHIVLGVQRREPGVEFVRVRDIGLSDHPNAVILDYANQHGFLMVSHDVNTMPAAAYARMREGNIYHRRTVNGSTNLSGESYHRKLVVNLVIE